MLSRENVSRAYLVLSFFLSFQNNLILLSGNYLIPLVSPVVESAMFLCLETQLAQQKSKQNNLLKQDVTAEKSYFFKISQLLKQLH